MTDPRKEYLQQPLFYALVLIAGYLAYLIVRPFLVPLGWAAIFGMMFYRAQGILAQRFGPSRAALVITLLTALLIVAPAVMLASVIAHEAPQVVEYVQQASLTAPRQIERVWTLARARSPVDLPGDPSVVLRDAVQRSEEHTSELQSLRHLVCRPSRFSLFPYTTLFRSRPADRRAGGDARLGDRARSAAGRGVRAAGVADGAAADRAGLDAGPGQESRRSSRRSVRRAARRRAARGHVPRAARGRRRRRRLRHARQSLRHALRALLHAARRAHLRTTPAPHPPAPARRVRSPDAQHQGSGGGERRRGPSRRRRAGVHRRHGVLADRPGRAGVLGRRDRLLLAHSGGRLRACPGSRCDLAPAGGLDRTRGGDAAG